jgi:hypothetical protein
MERHFHVVSRNTHFMGAVPGAAMSTIDVAMGDILGKALGRLCTNCLAASAGTESEPSPRRVATHCISVQRAQYRGW